MFKYANKVALIFFLIIYAHFSNDKWSALYKFTKRKSVSRQRIIKKGGAKTDNSKSSGTKRRMDDEKKMRGRPKKRREFLKTRVQELRTETLADPIVKCIQILRDEAAVIRKQIHSQLSDELIRPPALDDDAQRVRILCRLNFHLWRGLDYQKWVNITDVFSQIWMCFKEDKKWKMEDECDDLLDIDTDSDEIYETKCHDCSSDCPEINVKEANVIFRILEKFVENDLECQEMDHLWEWLSKYRECYQGIRSLWSRTKEIRNIKNALENVMSRNTVPTTTDISNLTIGHKIKDKLWAELPEEQSQISLHTTSSVFHNFGGMIANFQKELQRKLDDICDVCKQMTISTEIKRVPLIEIADFLFPTYQCLSGCQNLTCNNCLLTKVKLCTKCNKDIRKDVMPTLSTRNELQIDELPKQLADLNCIEWMLLKKARVIQQIVYLSDIKNRPTGMAACRGAMVVLGTNVEANINKILVNLPSGQNVKIVVNTGWQQAYVVCMKKMLIALDWLIKYNPEYQDVVINRHFKLSLGEDVIFEDQSKTQRDADFLLRPTDNDETVIDLVEHVLPLHPINQSVSSNRDNSLPNLQFDLKKITSKPRDREDERNDIQAFVDLFPLGRGGMFSSRPKTIPFSQYIRSRLLNVCRTFALNTKWICYIYSLKIQRSISSVQSVQARLAKDTFNQTTNLNDPTLIKSLTYVFAKVRGFRSYWYTVRRRLMFHIAQFGRPHWFATFNANEALWKDLHVIYSKLYDVDVDATNIRQFIEKDPSVFSRYFHKRLREFLRTMIFGKTGGAVGKIVHYFYRIEYQKRGHQHAHCLFWDKHGPSESATPSEVTAYIDKHLTNRIPGNDEPELAHLVDTCQRHYPQHTNTCKRIRKHNGQLITTCRFGFPRPVRQNTVLITDEQERENHNKCYELRRTTESIFINDYNPALLMAWEGNVDLQYVGSESNDVVAYITAYSCKNEIAKKLLEINDVNEQTTLKEAIYKMGIDQMNSRDIGALEMCDDLLGHQNYRFDRSETWITTEEPANRRRLMNPKHLQGESGDLFVSNMIDQHYPNRPQELEHFSLFNVSINFYHSKVKGHKKFTVSNKINKTNRDDMNDDVDVDDEEDYWYHTSDRFSPFFDHPTLSYGSGYSLNNVNGSPKTFLIKNKQKVGSFFLPVADDNDLIVTEDVYRRLCLLFIPWREEISIKDLYGKVTYYETFHHFLEMTRQRSENGYNDIMKCVRNFRNLNSSRNNVKRKSRQIEIAVENAETDDGGDVGIAVRQVVVDAHEKSVNQLNDQQKQIFEDVMGGIEKQQNGQCGQLIYVSGTAGVGKSFLIKVLADAVELRYANEKSAVLIAAPTGLSALAIGGQTVHSLFAIHVEDGRDSIYRELNDEARDLRRTAFANVKLLIVDEISMLSSVLLAKVRNRLRELFVPDLEFGGLSIVVLGDLLQIPPVRAPPVFAGLTPYITSKFFGGSPIPFNFWHLFKFAELTINQRQKEDVTFSEILARVRTKSQTEDDIKLLEERIIPQCRECNGTFAEKLNIAAHFYLELQKVDPHVLTILPLRADVELFNMNVLKLTGKTTYTITSVDTSVGSNGARKTTQKKSRPWQLKEYSIKSKAEISKNKSLKYRSCIAGGLSETLVVAESCRVMLCINLDKQHGLVNGATGILESIESDGEFVDTLAIRFDHQSDIVRKIGRHSVLYTTASGQKKTRCQFPIQVAYAATVHKVQGITLKNAIISTKHMFADAQLFVAISRLRDIKGLHFVDFDASKIAVDIRAIVEYNRLRNPASNTYNRLRNPASNTIRLLTSTADLVTNTPYKEDWLRLKNSGSDCFLIAGLNLLSQCLTMPQSTPTTHPFITEITKIMNQKTNHVRDFRKLLSNDLRVGQQDIIMALSEIVENLPDDWCVPMTVTQSTVGVCDHCKTSSTRKENLKMIQCVVRRKVSLNNAISKCDRVIRCELCQRITEATVEYEIPAQTKFVMINIAKTSRDGQICDLLETMDVFGKTWKLRGFAEYVPMLGEYGSNGHYTCWLNREQRWTRLSDDISSGHQNVDLAKIDISVILLALE